MVAHVFCWEYTLANLGYFSVASDPKLLCLPFALRWTALIVFVTLHTIVYIKIVITCVSMVIKNVVNRPLYS